MIYNHSNRLVISEGYSNRVESFIFIFFYLHKYIVIMKISVMRTFEWNNVNISMDIFLINFCES